MDSRNLHTASSYINNLLLSRGLLRNGVPIDFAEPTKTEGGVDETMARVMNLVHDLILRRDREADTLATISFNLQSVRTSAAQQIQTIARLESSNTDISRQLTFSNAQEKSARVALRSAETRTKALREEMTRLKGTVAQIRGQCANDIRRRDAEIARLKRHLEDRRGRSGISGQVGVVVITPGPSRPQHNTSGGSNGCVDVASPEYSLKQETTDFLTQLSQGLSDENDALIGLVRSTLATLRSLQGLTLDATRTSGVNSTHDRGHPAALTTMAPPSYDELASDTDQVLEHLRGLLTNPSFVPLEEVEIREDEIIRLREGWEKMAARWKEAVAMMNGWRKRMVDTGDTINLEDLTRGMDLAAEIPAAPEGERISADDSPGREAFSIMSDAEREADLDATTASLPAGRSGTDQHQAENSETSKALQDRSANARPALSPRKVSFPGIPEENETTREIEALDDLLDFSSIKTQSSPLKYRSHPSFQDTPSPRTVQQKLDAAQAEAENARHRVEQKDNRKKAAKAVNNRLKGSRRRSTLSPEELENLMGAIHSG